MENKQWTYGGLLSWKRGIVAGCGCGAEQRENRGHSWSLPRKSPQGSQWRLPGLSLFRVLSAAWPATWPATWPLPDRWHTLYTCTLSRVPCPVSRVLCPADHRSSWPASPASPASAATHSAPPKTAHSKYLAASNKATVHSQPAIARKRRILWRGAFSDRRVQSLSCSNVNAASVTMHDTRLDCMQPNLQQIIYLRICLFI